MYKCTISTHYRLLSAFASCLLPELFYSRMFAIVRIIQTVSLAAGPSRVEEFSDRNASCHPNRRHVLHGSFRAATEKKWKTESPLSRFFNRGCLLHYHFSRAATASVAEICTHKHSEETAGGPVLCDTLAPVMPLKIYAGAGSNVMESSRFSVKLCHKIFFLIFVYFCCISAAGTCTYREERDGIAYCAVYTFLSPPPVFFFLVFVLIVCSRVKTETFHAKVKRKVLYFVCLAGKTIWVCYDVNHGASGSHFFSVRDGHTSPQFQWGKKNEECAVSFFFLWEWVCLLSCTACHSWYVCINIHII